MNAQPIQPQNVRPVQSVQPVQNVQNQPVQQPPKTIPIGSSIANMPCPSKVPHEKAMFDKIMEFENDAFNPQTKGFTTGFAEIDKALEGLQTGFHIVAGDSNMGKTGFLSQMAWQVAQNNADAYVMDFSLDDPMKDKLPRVVACGNKVIINAVRNPIGYSQFPEMIKRRNEGMQKLVGSIDKYCCYDSSFSSLIEKIEEEIKRVKIELSANGIKKRICVFIDNFHDLDTTDPKAKGGDKAKYDFLAQKVSDMATELDVPIVCTAEFRKINGFRRPSVDDLRESVKIKYEAKSVMLIYNEVSLKGEAAQIFFTINGKQTKQPVFEVKFGKNKYSSFKGRVFFYFFPEMALFQAAPPQAVKTFNNLLYSNG